MLLPTDDFQIITDRLDLAQLPKTRFRQAPFYSRMELHAYALGCFPQGPTRNAFLCWQASWRTMEKKPYLA